MKRFEGRCGRAQYDGNLIALRAHDREVARRVTKPLVLLERSIVLFVHDDEPEPLHRTEHRGARADHDARSALAGGTPRLQTLGIVQRRMHDRDRQWKSRAKTLDEL